MLILGLFVTVDGLAIEGCWQANAFIQLTLDHGSSAQESVLRVPDNLCFAADGSVYDDSGLAYRGSWAKAGNNLKIDFNPNYYEALLQPSLTAYLGAGAKVSIGTARAYGKASLDAINSELILTNTTIFDGTGTAVGKFGGSGNLQASLTKEKAKKDAAYSTSSTGSVYEGHWESIRGGAGNVFSSSVFISINIKSDGSFSGRYQKYRPTGNAGMCNPRFCFGFSVWNPGGPAKKVKGNINFDTLTGTIKFHGLRTVKMDVEILSDNELYMSLPTGFRYAWVKVRR